MILFEQERVCYLESVVELQDEYILGKIDRIEYLNRKKAILQQRQSSILKRIKDADDWMARKQEEQKIANDLFKTMNSSFERAWDK